jgi:hypothetical protein
MTPEAFCAFLSRKGWSDYRAARELGCSRSSIAAWKVNGAPKYIALACLALGMPLSR